MMLSPLKSTLSRNTLNAVKAASVATRSYRYRNQECGTWDSARLQLGDKRRK